VSLPVVGLHQTVDVSALLAEETFQASGPVPGVSDAETLADEGPRHATRKSLDRELECTAVSAKQTMRNIQATGTGSYRPTFKMLKKIRQRANRKKKRALKRRNSNTESVMRPEIPNQGLFASDPSSPFLPPTAGGAPQKSAIHSFGSVPSLPQTPPVMSSIQTTEGDSVLLSAPPGEASFDGETRAAPVRSPPTSAPSDSDDLKKRDKKKSEKSFSPSGWIPITEQAVFAAVQHARSLERWPSFTQPSPPDLFAAAKRDYKPKYPSD
jgi:hypothetical protein